MPAIKLSINGKVHDVDVPPGMPLLWVLRDVLGLTGTKFSCGRGLCGSCTVHLNGEATRSCVTAVEFAEGKNITTIEGFAEHPTHPLFEAWIAEDVPQCGYCQPGQIMTAAALLKSNPDPSDSEIDTAMALTLCRCGTYPRIRKAIKRAAKAQVGQAGRGGKS
jgi:isoquinoline 1-oxidoreductase subunit alpha